MNACYKTMYQGVMSENKRKSAPTEQDYDELRALLNDFGKKDITIPKFKTVSEMEMWRKKILTA